MTMPEKDPLHRLRQSIEEYPRRLNALTQQVKRTASQAVTGHAANGQVVATLTANGGVQSVQITWRALRDLDRWALAQYVTDAVNDGLDQADALIAAETAADPSTDLDQAFTRFEEHVDDLLYQMDRVDRQLDRLDE